jgi:UDP:flavonoid glycosyltransferase YjiC (YdhE family)
VTRSVVSPHVTLPDDVHVVTAFPLATYQRAFDVAISAAGYNSFHELLRFGTPTLFVPKRNSAMDDQDRRARWAADQGWSHYADRVSESATVDVLTDLLEYGDGMIAKLAHQDPGNGAEDAARMLSDIHARKVS